MAINRRPIKYFHWNIFRGCNYSCSYCSSRNRKRDLRAPSPYLFLDKFPEHLTGSWRIQLAGSGEPLLTHNFLEIIRELIKAGHQIGLLTNFSAPVDKIEKFCEITKGNLFEFGVSLHLERANPEKFLEKAVKIKKLAGDSFSVRSVVRKGQVEELKKIAQMFQKKGIHFSMQPERDHGDEKNLNEESFVNYNKKELDIIRDFRGEFSSRDNLKLKGKRCWAGSKYFVINEDGEAWQCQPARRYKNTKGYLGNLLRGDFKLRKSPLPCRYKYCYCLAAIVNNIVNK